ncbi:MAG: AAA family ATPase [Oscillospiraceae bacterium]
MSSIFEKVSTRMFCISGALSDIYCTPDLRIYSFEELLNEKLKSLGYKYVVFYSGAKKRMFAIDSECGSRLSEFTTKQHNSSAQEQVKNPAPAPASVNPALSVNGVQRTIRQRNADSGKQKSNVFHIKSDTNAPVMANQLMLNTDLGKKALVFTSLDDFLNSSEELRREFYAYFEDWKSLPNENGNICIFVSKSINSQNLQTVFEGQSAIALRSLFIKGLSSGTAEFNHNSSLIIGSPLNDEILNLLEYLRIKGYTYTYRNENNEDITITKKLSFSKDNLDSLLRALSFFNRESDYSELKTMKESIEAFMRESSEERVHITPDDIPKIYGQKSGSFKDEDDPLELLKTREGWEAAGEVVGGFIDNYRANYKVDSDVEEIRDGSYIERFEPQQKQGNSRVKVPNFVLQGNPGVGKTEIANLIGRILQREGILKSGHTVIGTRDKLVGQYVGSTAVQTAALIEQAQEGVLLIDEVYTLAEKGEDGGSGFCSEAINTLVAAMTNKNYHFCVIFAGYANRMEDVWKMNEGLFSRFGEANIITIEEYKPPLLQKIFESSVMRQDDSCKQIVISEDVREGLPEFFKNLYSDRDVVNFGNARDMNNLADTVKRRAGIRQLHDQVITIERVDFGDKAKLFEKRGFSTTEIYSKLDEYIGLDFLKDMFNDQISLKVEYEEKQLEYPGPSHMIWAGNPGTGKSTAAQLTAELYHSLGILGSDKPIYIDASNLVGQYVGHSEKNINDKMDEAIQHHTILVIEEAYQLAENDFGRRIIDAMLNKMEANRKDFNVIFIVYSNRVEQFLNCNPGLESRLQRYEFKDYTPEQLFDIFALMCKKNKDEFSEAAGKVVYSLLQKLYDSGLSKNGNARIVRKLLDEMRRNRYRRIQEKVSKEMGLSTSEIAVMRSMGKLQVPEDAYVFEPSDVPENFFNEMERFHGKKKYE